MEIGFYILDRQWHSSARLRKVIQAMIDGIPGGINYSQIVVPMSGGEQFRPEKLYDIAVSWSIYKKYIPATIFKKRVFEFQKEHDKEFLVLERGFVKREKYNSVGYNHQNGYADFKNEFMPPDRWKETEEKIKPYRSEGKHILLCGQIPHDTSVQDIDYNNWLNKIPQEIAKYTDRPIIFRQHPLVRNSSALNGVSYSHNKYLFQDLANCWAVVSYNSNSLVDAALAGIPGFASDKSCMAWEVSNHDLSKLENPDLSFNRERWAYDLAYSQWSLEEMKEGKAWEHLLP